MATTITFDLEEHCPHGTARGRFPQVTNDVLAYLDRHGAKATFFVVGAVAESEPELIRKVAAEGHEIAFHSHDHLHLTLEAPTRFLSQSRDSKALLEDISGTAVGGFRAPAFSLVPDTVWVVDALMALGFRYSSSVLPAANPMFGFPGAPSSPFRWQQGLLELPVPTARFLGKQLPYLGGVYLRYLPLWWTLRMLSQEQGMAWSYLHPYDFDVKGGYCRIPNTGLLTSLLLWLNRRGTYRKLEGVMAMGVAAPLGDRVAAGEFDHAPHFSMDG